MYLHQVCFIYSSLLPRNSTTMWVNTSRPEQNGWHIVGYIFKCILLKEKFCILIQITPKFIPYGAVGNNSVFIQAMAWCNKPLPVAIVTKFHDATKAQWVTMTTGVPGGLSHCACLVPVATCCSYYKGILGGNSLLTHLLHWASNWIADSWGFWCQKQVSRAWISNYISQYFVCLKSVENVLSDFKA